MDRQSDWPPIQDSNAARRGGMPLASNLSMGKTQNSGAPGSFAANLPKPRPGNAGRGKLIACALMAVLVLAFAAFWLTATPAQKTELRKEAAGRLNDLLGDTPLAVLGRALAPAPEAPPPPPESVINPPTEAGTLSGREVMGTIAAPMDFGPLLPRSTKPVPAEEKTLRDVIHEAANDIAEFVGVQEKPQVTFNQDFVPPATEDSILRPGYIASLARWLANRYKPGNGGGSLAVSAQNINQECGVNLAGQVEGGRQALLRYAFQADMILGLYKLYIGRFLKDLDAAAADKGFNDAQKKDFHAAIAGRAALYANALEGIINLPSLPDRLGGIDAAAEKVVESSLAVTTAVFDLDKLRQEKASRQLINTAQLKVNGASARYRRAVDEHAKSQAELAAAIRKDAGPGLDDDALLFLAAWAGRREAHFTNAHQALESGVKILRDLAERCRAIAEER